MELKPNSITSIQYIIVHSKNPGQYLFQYPLNPTNFIYNWLMRLPIDLLQLCDSPGYFERKSRIPELQFPINALIFSEEQLLTREGEENPIYIYIKMLNLENRVVVTLIDKQIEDIDSIQKAFIKAELNFFYYSFFNLESSELIKFSVGKYFEGDKELLTQIQSDLPEIEKILKSVNPEYEILTKSNSIDEAEPINEEEVYNFKPFWPNFFTINHAKCSYWKFDEITPKIPEVMERSTILTDQFKRLDDLHLKIRQKSNFSRFLYPIGILSFPSNNPTFKKHLKENISNEQEKVYTQALSLEQDHNYMLAIEYSGPDEDFEKYRNSAASALMLGVAPRLKTLDGASYLHSTFTHSPVLRFPLIGKSIYRELAFFSPKSKNFLSEESKKQLHKTIHTFGEKLKNQTISESFKDYIESRNGQILTISDLPIEWLSINGRPISFTHDVCRIPEVNYQAIYNHYSANNRLKLSINEETVKRTLVILGATSLEDEDNFKGAYEMVKRESSKIPFKFAICNNINDVKKAVSEFNPDILIFDCHAGIDPAKQTSYILINDEKIYGDEIVENNIFAPIIFLSCCATSPLFGYNYKIHDAFFEAGALTVTATFLPISNSRGTRFYLRLLQLIASINSWKFYNWLELVSHTIRSAIIIDALDKHVDSQERELNQEELSNLSALIESLLVFEKRKDIFDLLKDGKLKLSEELLLGIKDTESEFLLYTHYGRPDLILVESEKN